MSSPYYRVRISDEIRLHPRDMNNNILENIKREAVKSFTGKCYKDYGFIEGIYELAIDEERGVIQSEDPTSSALYGVTMLCRILAPIQNSLLYAKITGITEEIALAEMGELKIYIPRNNINTEKIRYVKSAYYPVNTDGKPNGEAIQQGTAVIIKLLQSKIVPQKTNIFGFGILESVVPPEDYHKIHSIDDEQMLTVEQIEAIRGRGDEDSGDSEISSVSETESDAGSDVDSDVDSDAENANASAATNDNAASETDTTTDSDSIELTDSSE